MDYRHIQNIKKFNAKKVYYVAGIGFESDKGTKNGMEKAKNYCFENHLNTNDIIVFDSETEYLRYLYLKNQEMIGNVANISIHQLFPVLSAFDSAIGKHHEALEYEADFVYTDLKRNRKVVEDVKGSKYSIEEVFYVKWKVFDLRYKKENLAIEVAMLKDRKKYLDSASWYSLDDISTIKSMKNIRTTKKLEELKKLKEAETSRLKLEKVKEKYLHLKSLEKPTKAQKERLNEFETQLKEAGYIL